MLVKIIGALLIVAFFVFINKVGSALLDSNNETSKLFPIGSTLLGTFLVGLIFLG
jgi:uncharacterized integral membrane protein